MKLVMIPPYSTANKKMDIEQEIIANMGRRGQLEGVELDLVEGAPIDFSSEGRSAEFTALISPGAIKKVKEYSDLGKHAAIIQLGTMEPGFYAAQIVSKIPVVYSLHAAVHIASFIGERFSIIHITDDEAHVVRRSVQNHGLGHKLASVRPTGYTSMQTFRLVQKYKKEERAGTPEGKAIIDAIVSQCKMAVDKDMADTLVFECPLFQIFDAEIRQSLDDAGYGEIQTISSFSAAVAVAKAVVSLKLIQAPIAYPGRA